MKSRINAAAPAKSTNQTFSSHHSNPNSKLTTHHSNLNPRPRRRFSKIARLPAADRELLNLMLRDGEPYSLITKKLAERGHSLTKDNVSRWHSGGHTDWLREQSWLEEMRVRLHFASNIVTQEKGQLLDAASLRIAVTRMYNVLLAFDPCVLTSKIAENPQAYTRLLNSLCHLAATSLKFERHRQDQQFPSLTPCSSTATT